MARNSALINPFDLHTLSWHGLCSVSACWRVPGRILQNSHVAPTRTFSKKENDMLYYAAVFLVIALVAALFGFAGIAAGAVEIAKIIFVIFLVLFLVSLVAGLLRRGP